MYKNIIKHLTNESEIEYEHHPRIFWILFFIFAFIFLSIQSYLAVPRAINELFKDLFFPILIVLSSILLFLSPKNRNLLILGVTCIILTAATYIFEFIPKPYGTFLFLYGVWLLVDWYNYKNIRKSLFSELIKGNYYLAFGIFISTFALGLITELVNLPFLAWQYNIPLPSLNFLGIPALIAAFGWIPWVLSILAIFYPFVLKTPRKFK